jgi:subtilisin family serine protease
MSRSRRRLAAGAIAVACTAGLAGVVGAQAETGTAAAQRYLVVYKANQAAAGKAAVEAAGGRVVSANDKIGVATAESSQPEFAARAGASNAIDAVGEDAAFREGGVRGDTTADGATQFPDSGTVATGCGQQYQPPGGTGVGPDPLSVCQWDMRISNASPSGSYAVNQGQGATIGVIDTGVDMEHPDIRPNLSVPLSCSFIRPDTPTALPQEYEPDPNCSTKSAVQDYNGHGTHTSGEAAAPINGEGVAGVAPKATIAGLKAGTAEGYFFTQPVVDALVWAGDRRIDVVNMSFFADPYLFNCKNDATQKAIVKAISRAAQYAHNRGVVLVGSAGNQSDDLDHPTTDPLSPDYPPGSEVPRPVGNNCVVVPAELPWTVTVSAIGPQKRLSFYSSYGNSKVDVTAAGGASDQAPNPYGRVLNAWSATAPPTAAGNPTRTVEDCQGPSGTPPCVRWAWVQGTSMSSPHTAGVAALIRAAHPGMPPTSVEAKLQNTAMPMSCPPADDRCTGGGQTNFYGNGLVDALAAGTR